MCFRWPNMWSTLCLCEASSNDLQPYQLQNTLVMVDWPCFCRNRSSALLNNSKYWLVYRLVAIDSNFVWKWVFCGLRIVSYGTQTPFSFRYHRLKSDATRSPKNSRLCVLSSSKVENPAVFAAITKNNNNNSLMLLSLQEQYSCKPSCFQGLANRFVSRTSNMPTQG